MTRLRTLALGATLFTALAAAPFVVHAASPGAPTPFKPARNAFGQPDLQGNWSNVSMTPESRGPGITTLNYTPDQVAKLEGAAKKEEVEANKKSDPNAGAPAVGGDKPLPGTRPEFAAAGGAVGGYDRGWLDPGNGVMRVGGQARTSIITTASGRAPPVKAGATPEPQFRGGANNLGPMDNVEQRSLGERCIMGFGRNAGPPMLANGFYNNDYQIIQTKDEVAIVVEMVHDVRHIRLGGTHRTDGIRPWMGDSIGHYEGNTLVAETTNFPRAMAYHGSWENLKVTERFTKVSKDRILYQFTVEDPTRWDQPWGGEYEFHPLGGEIYEYACHEGNYALEHILAGARQEERIAAEKAKGGPAKGS